MTTFRELAATRPGFDHRPGAKHRISVVLVHGAWADGSSWNDIIGPLLAKGPNVLAAPIPLTSLSDDVAALDRALERTNAAICDFLAI